MSVLNSLIFLLSISFSALILPSLIPGFSLLLVASLCFLIFLNISIRPKTYKYEKSLNFIYAVNYSNIYIPILAILLLSIFLITKSFDGSFKYFSNFGLLLIHVLFLVFILNTKEYIQTYLKSYIYLVFFMSILSLAAVILISLGLIDVNAHNFSLANATGGAFMRDVSDSSGGYSFPYGLGLVLTGSGKLDLLGVQFFRISGWAHEPTSATLFIAPSIIMLIHSNIISNNFTKYLFLIVIMLFWFLAMSVGSMLAFIAVYFFVITSTLYIKYFPMGLSTSLTFVGIIIFSSILFYVGPLLDSSIFSTKFDLSSQTVRVAIDQLTWFMPDTKNNLNYYFLHIALWSIISLFMYIVIKGILFQRFLNMYSIILLYIIIHSMKGSQESVYGLLFAFFWFYMAYFSIIKETSR